MRLSIIDRRWAPIDPLVVDVSVTALGGATLAELVDRVVAMEPRLRPLGPADFEASVDGTAVPMEIRLERLSLRSGSVVTLGVPEERPMRGRARLALTQIAGPDCGRTVDLTAGPFALGPRSGYRPAAGLDLGHVRRTMLRLDVDASGDCEVAPVEATDVRRDGVPLLSAEPAGPGTVLTVGDAAFRLHAPAAPAVGGESGGDGQGRTPLIRTPRVAVPEPSSAVTVPAAPSPSTPPAPMSWLLMLAPLPIGILMAIVFSPFFLIMTMMTPMMALARWLEGRIRAKREARRLATETAAAAARFGDDLDRVRAAVGAGFRAAHPDLGELWRRARTGRLLWQVRPGDADELRLALGIGPRPWQPDLGRRDGGLGDRPELAEVLQQRRGLIDVPVLADLRERAGLGVVGPAEIARPLAAAVVLDLVARHGPADVGVALLVEPGRSAEWEWMKWLPHLADDDGTPRVAADAEAAAALLQRLIEKETRRTAVVIDGDELLTGGVAALLGRFARGTGRAVVVTGQVRRLPSVCHTIVELDDDGRANVTDAVTGDLTEGVRVARVASDVATGTARALSSWTDPELATAAALLPERARLLDLFDAEGLDSIAIAQWWDREESGLRALLGVTEQGPLEVDLLTDGPHGLIVGTTGAGKSELLRTLVASLACRYSPQRLTFMLVDFKGGGAFDACAALPHTAGLVTDLDEHLAARALRCLRAELRHRERRLREAGVTDLRDYHAPDPPLPRLLIVIDEFATLAVELPGFLSALVDVAQRGRSLGLHLLLATQRPQGVVDGKIRANTNLRIALRVQEDADSRDVLNSRLAADIDRRRPGRGYVRFGAGEVVAFQTALVSATAVAGRVERIEVEAFRLLNDVESTAPSTVESGAEGVPSDLVALADAAREAFGNTGFDPPRVPWPPPLPDRVDAWSLPEDGAEYAPLGLVDLPDEQRSDVWKWRPEDGGMLVLGADPVATAAVLATACLSLSRVRSTEQQRIFILDGTGSGLTALGGLPHVAAAIGVDDGERVARVLDWLDTEVIRRRTTGTDGPSVLLVLAGWGAVIEGAERAGLTDIGTRLERLLRDGATTRVAMLIAAAHERAVPGKILAQLPVKLCLRLADPTGYVGLGLRAREVPDLSGTQAIEVQTRQELVVARYDDATGLASAVARIAESHPTALPVTEIGVLPELVPAADVLGASAVTGAGWRLGLGRDYRDLLVATLDLAAGMHAVVTGPAGSGRTTALRVLAAAARASAPEAVICVVAADPREWDGTDVSEVEDSVAALQQWPASGRALLLVDGIDGLGPAAGATLDQLLPELAPTAHVVVAGRPEALRGLRPWQRAVTQSRTGLLLRPGAEDGELLRMRLPRDAPPRPIPGRGYLVDGGVLRQVQVAHLPPGRGASADHELKALLSLPTSIGGHR